MRDHERIGRGQLAPRTLANLTLAAARNAENLLALGYTAFVGAGSVPGLDMALRRAVDRGELRGPRITPCSRDLMVSGPPERRNPEVKKRIPTDLMRLADTPEEMAEYVATEIAQGAEIVKVFSSGDDTFPNGRSHELLFTPEELKIAARTAHEHGALIRAHSPGLDGIRNAIAAGADVIDHATYADDEALHAIAERGIFVVPSLYQPHMLLTTGTQHGKTTEYLETLEFEAEVANTLRILPIMVELGIPVVAGDDFGFAWIPHGTYAKELELYVEKSRYWGTTHMDGQPRTVVIFPEYGCRNCRVRPACTSGFTRRLTLHPREEHELLQRQRAEQNTDAWKQRYAKRAGVEGTICQAVRATGIRCSRYRGRAKTGLAHVFSATAIDLHRMDAHLTGRPVGTTHFADLDLDPKPSRKTRTRHP
ncbi:transposase [Streptomyces sp. NPDC056165]|uniref:transposase n=1 Tax=Streptomyces sp. NPDC056165 TaxID=3345733 RepID=UPI0035D7B512